MIRAGLVDHYIKASYKTDFQIRKELEEKEVSDTEASLMIGGWIESRK